ncbi:hypothetical protein SAY86_011026 [Trapa natans]|uniref:Uncharacterized protein n=1 Tax=Trapa natans TaxID=22666 RepID=A0AAN7LV77_TRANT|nr:hypothetical protein SAY86_011026 [Trapa natans]
MCKRARKDVIIVGEVRPSCSQSHTEADVDTTFLIVLGGCQHSSQPVMMEKKDKAVVVCFTFWGSDNDTSLTKPPEKKDSICVLYVIDKTHTKKSIKQNQTVWRCYNGSHSSLSVRFAARRRGASGFRREQAKQNKAKSQNLSPSTAPVDVPEMATTQTHSQNQELEQGLVEERGKRVEVVGGVGRRGEGGLELWLPSSLSSYLGISFSLFLALLPKNVLALHSESRELALRLLHAEDQLRQMRSRRKEDSKANARVVEIFASHRQAWQVEERRLAQRLESAAEEIERLRARVAELEQAEADSRARVEELEREREDIAVMGFDGEGVRVPDEEEEEEGGGGIEGERGDYNDFGELGGVEFEQIHQFLLHQRQIGSGLTSSEEFLGSSAAAKFWSERSTPWQDVHCESLEPVYQMKHFVSRRESPWKVDGESAGVSSKLKLLEQELINLEKMGKSELTKVPSLMRKQAKRYQALAGKIDELCRRMQASDPCEPSLSSEFRAQRQSEFLLEAFRLQQRASETGQKLMALHAEVGKSYYREELGNEAKKATTRRSMESIRNNFREIQRNLEIWMARIIGDLEGILARDGVAHVRECYLSRYPFVHQ